jgi:hypothetical protein
VGGGGGGLRGLLIGGQGQLISCLCFLFTEGHGENGLIFWKYRDKNPRVTIRGKGGKLSESMDVWKQILLLYRNNVAKRAKPTATNDGDEELNPPGDMGWAVVLYHSKVGV